MEDMEESRLYQTVVGEGVQRGKRRAYKETLLDLGALRFGLPAFSVRLALDLIDDADWLDRMAHRLFEAASWDDMLGTPRPTLEEHPILEASSTYQRVIEQGEDKGITSVLRKLVVNLARCRLGCPSTAVQFTINRIEARAQLNRMLHRLGNAASWEDLLTTC